MDGNSLMVFPITASLRLFFSISTQWQCFFSSGNSEIFFFHTVFCKRLLKRTVPSMLPNETRDISINNTCMNKYKQCLLNRGLYTLRGRFTYGLILRNIISSTSALVVQYMTINKQLIICTFI